MPEARQTAFAMASKMAIVEKLALSKVQELWPRHSQRHEHLLPLYDLLQIWHSKMRLQQLMKRKYSSQDPGSLSHSYPQTHSWVWP